MNDMTPPGEALDAAFAHRFFALLTRINRLLQLHADHNMPADTLSPPQIWFLKRLSDAGAPQPISYFADGVISSRSNATQMVDRLESEGLVARVRNPHDRRSVLVELTASGSDRLRLGHAELERMAIELLAPLSPDERESIIAAFERVLALFESQALRKHDQPDQ